MSFSTALNAWKVRPCLPPSPLLVVKVSLPVWPWRFGPRLLLLLSSSLFLLVLLLLRDERKTCHFLSFWHNRRYSAYTHMRACAHPHRQADIKKEAQTHTHTHTHTHTETHRHTHTHTHTSGPCFYSFKRFYCRLKSTIRFSCLCMAKAHYHILFYQHNSTLSS